MHEYVRFCLFIKVTKFEYLMLRVTNATTLNVLDQ